VPTPPSGLPAAHCESAGGQRSCQFDPARRAVGLPSSGDAAPCAGPFAIDARPADPPGAGKAGGDGQGASLAGGRCLRSGSDPG
jgi:hypothetical protein